MKSIVKTLIAASLSIAAVSACSEEKLSPSTTGTKTTVHFGATSSIVDGATKATLTTDDETRFIGAWENGDELLVKYSNEEVDDEITTATWNGSSFEATLTEATGVWMYEVVYPAPTTSDNSVDFGSARTQKGNAYNSKYDIMIGSAMTDNAAAGKDDEGNNIVFKMDRQTAIAYFHFTSSIDEAITSATLSVSGDNAFIASSSASVSGIAWASTEDCKSITITFPEEAPNAKDFQLWFNVLATKYESISLTVETATKTLTINNAKSGKYEAGHLYKAVKTIPDDKWVEKTTSLLELITDASTLKAGDKLIIASTNKDVVAGPLAVTNKGTQDYLSAVAYDFDLSNAPNGALILTLGGDSGAWTLSNVDNELLGSTSVKKLTFDSSETNFVGTWTIAIDNDNNATIASTSSNYGRILHNSSATRFLNYANSTSISSSMLLPQLYRYHGVVLSKSEITIGNSDVKLDGVTLMVGKDISLEATTNSTAELTYSSDKPEVASVDAEGVITAKSEGTAVITVSVAENDEYYAAEKEITVNVVGKYEQEITYTDASKILVAGSTLNLEAKAKGELSYSSDDEEVASVSNEGVVKAIAEGKAVITISAAETDEYKAATATVEITVRPEGAQTKYFVKVTEAPTDWSGTYLIVYEDGNVAFNGSLDKLDAAKNNIAVTISDNKIEENDTILKSTFEIAAISGSSNYSIKSASGYYISGTSSSNKLNTSKSSVGANSIEMQGGDVLIKSNTSVLRFNSSTSSLWFRYFKSTSYTNQKAIQLYRLEE